MKVLVLVLGMGLGVLLGGVAVHASSSQGDVNCDGTVDPSDALAVLRINSGLTVDCAAMKQTWRAPDGTKFDYYTPAQLEAASDSWFASYSARQQSVSAH